jgi:hypothetical protein
MLCGADDWYMYAFDFGTGTGDWPLHRYDEYNTAYSPDGLTKWQYVMANCTTHMNVTTCTITNTYDHDVINIILHLKNDMIVDWYDVSGNLLKSKSNNFTIDFLSSSSSSIYLLKYEMQVPNKPTKPLGPITGKSGILYTYTTQTTDPNEDALYYWFDWGDGSASGWLGPYRSGEECNASHIWTTQGSYQIKSKAKDVYGWESLWSDPLPVTMPYSKMFHTHFIMFKALSERLPLLLKILEKIE